MLPSIVVQHPPVQAFCVCAAAQDLTVRRLEPLPLLSCFQRYLVECVIERCVAPSPPATHTRTPSDFVQKTMHLPDVPQAGLVVQADVRGRHDFQIGRPLFRCLFFVLLFIPVHFCDRCSCLLPGASSVHCFVLSVRRCAFYVRPPSCFLACPSLFFPLAVRFYSFWRSHALPSSC